MSLTDVFGTLKYERWMHDKIGVNHIYSPSGLYSVLVHDDVLEYKKKYNPKEILILNNESLAVQHHKLNKEETIFDNVFETDSIVNIYWLTDTLLVCLQKVSTDMVQRIFSVDHEYQTIYHEQSRTFASNLDNFWFWLTQPCCVLDKISFVAYINLTVGDENGFLLHLIPKNPFSTEKPRKFDVRLGNVPEYDELLEAVVDIYPEIEGMSISEPRFVNNNKLLCPLQTLGRNGETFTIFGIFLEINLEFIEKSSAMDNLDRKDEDGLYFVFLPKPKDISQSDFYSSYNITEFPVDNVWLTKKDEFILRVVNFATMEHVRVVLPNKGPPVFTTHPSGLLFQWYERDDKIEFKKINISWKSDSLEEISRRAILYNKEIDYSHIRGFKQFLFPGAKFIEKEKTIKITNQIIKEVKPSIYNDDENSVKQKPDKDDLNILLPVLMLQLVVVLFGCVFHYILSNSYK